MPRRKPKTSSPETAEQHEGDTKRAKVRSIVGSNVTPETLKKHHNAIQALQARAREIAGQMSAAWKAAESDGIDRKAGKLVFKLFDTDPATFDAFMRQITTYSTQLGLFERVDDWKAEEKLEADKGSVNRAEGDLKKPTPAAEPKNGGREDAIYAQGHQAGLDNAPRNGHGYLLEDAETWQRGYHAGAMKRVDAANSELASA